MRKFLLAGCLSTTLIFCAQSPAIAQSARPISAAEFVKRAALSDMFELQSSEMAAIKANAPTRSFAAMMNAEHQKTSSELGLIVKGRAANLPLPPRLDRIHQNEIDKLNGLEGNSFSRRYQAIQIKAHKSAVALFSAYAQNGTDITLRSWAAKTLPKLKMHLEHAETLAANSSL